MVTTKLKLFIDSKSLKVVFAEADKVFVDFICDILTMPINSIIKLLTKDNDKAGVYCLELSVTFTEALKLSAKNASINKDWVLKPTARVCVPLLSLFDPPASGRVKLYTCGCNLCPHFTDAPGLTCPRRYSLCPSNLQYIEPESEDVMQVSEGYVKGVVKYMVMDSLEVKPLSLSLIKSDIKNIASLFEVDVEVGPDEGVAILKASLETQSVLTTVFLGAKLIKTEK